MEISCRLWFMWMQNLWSKYWLRIAPLINCAGCKSTDIEIRPVDLSQIQHSAHLTNRSACRLSQYLYIYCEASVVYQIDTRFHLTTWAASTSMCSRSGNVIACLSSPCKQIIRSKPLRFLLKTSPSTVSTDYFHVCAGGTEVCVVLQAASTKRVMSHCCRDVADAHLKSYSNYCWGVDDHAGDILDFSWCAVSAMPRWHRHKTHKV